LKINKEGLLSSGYQILKLLGSHNPKEETRLYEILNKKEIKKREHNAPP
jgi:hypothetical protein